MSFLDHYSKLSIQNEIESVTIASYINSTVAKLNNTVSPTLFISKAKVPNINSLDLHFVCSLFEGLTMFSEQADFFQIDFSSFLYMQLAKSVLEEICLTIFSARDSVLVKIVDQESERTQDKLSKSVFKFYESIYANETPAEKQISNNKYIATYYINIPADNWFKVTQRILGFKGRKIQNLYAQAIEPFPDIFSTDKLPMKIRLRGRGSGYMEGDRNRESRDPLQICASTKYFCIFKTADYLITRMLNELYKEYASFDRRSHLRRPKTVKKTVKIKNLN